MSGADRSFVGRAAKAAVALGVIGAALWYFAPSGSRRDADDRIDSASAVATSPSPAEARRSVPRFGAEPISAPVDSGPIAFVREGAEEAPKVIVVVKNDEGRPIEGARFMAKMNAFADLGRSSKDGSIGIPIIRSAALLTPVIVSTPGYRSQEILVDSRTTRREVVLERGRTIDGKVVDRFGAPVVGARIRATDLGFPNYARPLTVAEATSDDSGAFRVSGFGPSSEWRVDAPGYETRIERRKNVAADERLLFVLTPGRSVLVRVVDADDAPVADASVKVTWTSEGTAESTLLEAASSVDGTVRMSGIGEDVVAATLTVEKSGFVALTRRLTLREIDDGLAVARFAERSAEIFGRITTADGRGIRGLVITYIWNPSANAYNRTIDVMTNLAGLFRVVDVPPESQVYLDFRWMPEGSDTIVGPLMRTESFVIHAGEVVERSMTTPDLKLVTVKTDVVDPRRAVGLVISAESGPRIEGPRIKKITDFRVQTTLGESGQAQLLLPTGSYRFSADRSRIVVGRQDAQIDGDGSVVVPIAATPPVSGRIVTNDGRPYAHRPIAVVRKTGESTDMIDAQTDSDGRFSIEVPGPATIDLSVIGRRGEVNAAEIVGLDVTKAAMLEIVVHFGGIRGRVIDAGSLQEIRSEISFEKEGDAITMHRHPEIEIWSIDASSDGTFEIPDLSAGTWKLTARASGYLPRTENVVVAEGGIVTSTELKLSRGTWFLIKNAHEVKGSLIELRVVADDGREIQVFNWANQDGRSPSLGPFPSSRARVVAAIGGKRRSIDVVFSEGERLEIDWEDEHWRD